MKISLNFYTGSSSMGLNHLIIKSFYHTCLQEVRDTVNYYYGINLLFMMYTDCPGGASVQQPQSPPIGQTPVAVYSQPLTFSKDMSNEQLAQWLRSHPSLSGVDYEEDISKLIGIMFMYIHALVLASLHHNHDVFI